MRIKKVCESASGPVGGEALRLDVTVDRGMKPLQRAAFCDPIRLTSRTIKSVALLIATVFLLNPLSAQTYRAGEIVENFNLIDRSTGQPVNLYSLEGKVIFLEWFAHWCPFCQAAASQIGPGVVEPFKDAGGNTNGVEVVHISLNLQSGQETQTQAFIDLYELGDVWNDFSRTAASRFGTGQPIFAIINGVAGSSSHQQWELVYSQNGYGQTSFPIQTFLSEINSVTAAVEPIEPPIISIPPDSKTALAGDAISLTVEATGEDVEYQWTRDGMEISGATGPALSIAAVAAADEGAYRVRVTNEGGAVTSQVAWLTLVSPGASPAELANVSTRLAVGTGDRMLVAGFFVAGGGSGEILVRGIGPSLAGFGLEGVLEDPVLQLYQGGAEIAANDDWQDQMGSALVQMAWQGVGAFDLMMGTRDGVLYRELNPGLYSAQIKGVDESTGLGLVEVYDVAGGGGGVLTNISTRGRIVGDTEIMIMGFVLRGDAPRKVLIRAVGPTLDEFGVSGTVTDPYLRLYGSRSVDPLAENDRWTDTQADALADAMALVGAFPLEEGSEDSSILIGLPPGAYTAHVSAPADEEGVVLAEVYVLPE